MGESHALRVSCAAGCVLDETSLGRFNVRGRQTTAPARESAGRENLAQRWQFGPQGVRHRPHSVERDKESHPGVLQNARLAPYVALDLVRPHRRVDRDGNTTGQHDTQESAEEVGTGGQHDCDSLASPQPGLSQPRGDLSRRLRQVSVLDVSACIPIQQVSVNARRVPAGLAQQHFRYCQGIGRRRMCLPGRLPDGPATGIGHAAACAGSGNPRPIGRCPRGEDSILRQTLPECSLQAHEQFDALEASQSEIVLQRVLQGGPLGRLVRAKFPQQHAHRLQDGGVYIFTGHGRGLRHFDSSLSRPSLAGVRTWEREAIASVMEGWLAGIRIYPIKSLDPVEVSSVGLAAGRSLAGDREYGLFDSSGRYLNTKRLGPTLLRIRARYTKDFREVRLAADGHMGSFSLPEDRSGLADWLASRLNRPVRVRRDRRGGFPDDTQASGPTLVGTASLRAVSKQFGLSVEEVRRRFRANLEIDGLEPFEEDLLFGPPGEPRRFRLGGVELLGTNPCRRCSVPTRDSRGNPARGALQARSFAEFRASHCDPRSHMSSYPDSYRFAVNTVVSPGQSGAILAVGDKLDDAGPAST